MGIADRIDPLGIFPWYLFALPVSVEAYRKSCIHFLTFMLFVCTAGTLVGSLALLSPTAGSRYMSRLTPLGMQFAASALLLIPSLIALMRTRTSRRLDIFALALIALLPVISAMMAVADHLLFDQPNSPLSLQVVEIVFWCAVFWRFVRRGWALRAEATRRD